MLIEHLNLNDWTYWLTQATDSLSESEGNSRKHLAINEKGDIQALTKREIKKGLSGIIRLEGHYCKLSLAEITQLSQRILEDDRNSFASHFLTPEARYKIAAGVDILAQAKAVRRDERAATLQGKIKRAFWRALQFVLLATGIGYWASKSIQKRIEAPAKAIEAARKFATFHMFPRLQQIPNEADELKNEFHRMRKKLKTESEIYFDCLEETPFAADNEVQEPSAVIAPLAPSVPVLVTPLENLKEQFQSYLISPVEWVNEESVPCLKAFGLYLWEEILQVDQRKASCQYDEKTEIYTLSFPQERDIPLKHKTGTNLDLVVGNTLTIPRELNFKMNEKELSIEFVGKTLISLYPPVEKDPSWYGKVKGTLKKIQPNIYLNALQLDLNSSSLERIQMKGQYVLLTAKESQHAQQFVNFLEKNLEGLELNSQ